MEISEKLVKYKVHILVTLASCVVVSTLVLVVAPRFVTIVAYFWPLLLSTALFLAAVIFIGRTTNVSPAAAADSAGEGLLDFVAGEPDPRHLHHHHDNHRDHHDDHDDHGESLIKSDDHENDDDIGEHKLVETSTSKM